MLNEWNYSNWLTMPPSGAREVRAFDELIHHGHCSRCRPSLYEPAATAKGAEKTPACVGCQGCRMVCPMDWNCIPQESPKLAGSQGWGLCYRLQSYRRSAHPSVPL